MDETPQEDPSQHFVEYPRPHLLYGDADKLQALSDGYFGLNWVFLVNVVVFIVARLALVLAEGFSVLMIFGLQVLIVGLVVGLMSYPYNRKIAFGRGWSMSVAPIASVLMGLNSALCCGIVGYIVMQSLALQEIKRYGVKGGFFGIRKKDVQATIAQMRSDRTPAP